VTREEKFEKWWSKRGVKPVPTFIALQIWDAGYDIGYEARRVETECLTSPVRGEEGSVVQQ
jgi:hypothetical protein